MIVMLTIDTSKTLSESWERLAAELLKAGAGEAQLDVMRSAFFLGAVHIYARLDTQVADEATFYDTMDELMHELDGVRVEDLPVMGNA